MSPGTLPSIWEASLPAGWRWAKLNHVAKLGTGHTPDRHRPELWVDCDVPWVTAADLSQRSSAFEPLMETAQHVSRLGLRHSAAVEHPAGTVMFCRTASVGLFCITGRPMATTQAFVTWTPGPELEPRYLLYVIAAMGPEFDRLAYGSTHLTIYMPDLEALRIPLPPLEEQRRIANYLDDQTTRIDQAIQLRQRQAELLKARSLAPLVHLLVTAYPAGNSAVSWLPVSGSGWEVQRLSRVAKCHDGRRVPLSSEERLFRRGQFPYYGASTVVDHIDDFIFDGEYVLIGEDGAALERQDFDVVQEPSGQFWVNNHAHVLEGVSVTNSYLAEILRCVDRPLLVSGATRPKITQDDLMALRIPVPPQAEQVQLAEACKEIRKSSRHTLKSLELAIAKLQELRNSLISGAVSGEFDVSPASLGQ